MKEKIIWHWEMIDKVIVIHPSFLIKHFYNIFVYVYVYFYFHFNILLVFEIVFMLEHLFCIIIRFSSLHIIASPTHPILQSNLTLSKGIMVISHPKDKPIVLIDWFPKDSHTRAALGAAQGVQMNPLSWAQKKIVYNFFFFLIWSS